MHHMALGTVAAFNKVCLAVFLQAPPKADGSVPLYVPLSLDMLSDSDEAIVQLLQAGIQEGSCIVCSMVVALKVPQQGYEPYCLAPQLFLALSVGLTCSTGVSTVSH